MVAAIIIIYIAIIIIVKGIMVEFEPNIYIADKSIIFGRYVCFGILTRKKIGPRENPPLMHFGTMEMERNISNFLNFSLSGQI